MTIVATGSVSHFFSEAVEEAKKSRGIDATEGATQYLVGLLTDFAHPNGRVGQAMGRPLAFLLDEALREPDPGERFERLRSLGDGVLYACGFFGDHFEAKGLDHGYLVGIGARAYGTAGSMLLGEESGVGLFGELSHNFDRFVDVVSEVADATMASSTASSRGLLRVYERWLKTGSDRLAHALTTQGLVPTRGPKGVMQ
jgi:hypothetical protein